LSSAASAFWLFFLLAAFGSVQFQDGGHAPKPKANLFCPLPPPLPHEIQRSFNSLPVKHASDAFDAVPPGGGPLVSGVYELLTRGRVGPTHQDHPARRRAAAGLDGSAFARVAFDTAGLALRSMHAQALGSEPPLTTRTSTFEGVLDYLFLSEGHWDVPAVLEMPYAHDSSGGGGSGGGGGGGGPSEAPSHAVFPPAPNEVWPSDHFAVGADLLLCV
jgi:CCR4-NOT transcription complex subunit 6